MTEGHVHRVVPVKRDGLIHRVLTKPLIYSGDLARIDASPYPWGPDYTSRYTGSTWGPVDHTKWTRYYLSTLSILHRWTGLTLELGDR